MPRMARLVIPGFPHHVTQRGNRKQKTFFSSGDYALYLKLLTESCQQHDVEIWAYCLMPNHIHLIAVPKRENSLGPAIGRAHKKYSRFINSRQEWKGHLWQERFASFVMDRRYLLNAARYVELNPVRAGLVERAQDWPYSSAAAHTDGLDNRVVKVGPLLDLMPDWSRWLAAASDDTESDTLRLHTQTGRPLGDETFLRDLEALTGRALKSKRRGRPSIAERD